MDIVAPLAPNCHVFRLRNGDDIVNEAVSHADTFVPGLIKCMTEHVTADIKTVQLLEHRSKLCAGLKVHYP